MATLAMAYLLWLYLGLNIAPPLLVAASTGAPAAAVPPTISVSTRDAAALGWRLGLRRDWGWGCMGLVAVGLQLLVHHAEQQAQQLLRVRCSARRA